MDKYFCYSDVRTIEPQNDKLCGKNEIGSDWVKTRMCLFMRGRFTVTFCLFILLIFVPKGTHCALPSLCFMMWMSCEHAVPRSWFLNNPLEGRAFPLKTRSPLEKWLVLGWRQRKSVRWTRDSFSDQKVGDSSRELWDMSKDTGASRRVPTGQI